MAVSPSIAQDSGLFADLVALAKGPVSSGKPLPATSAPSAAKDLVTPLSGLGTSTPALYDPQTFAPSLNPPILEKPLIDLSEPAGGGKPAPRRSAWDEPDEHVFADNPFAEDAAEAKSVPRPSFNANFTMPKPLSGLEYVRPFVASADAKQAAMNKAVAAGDIRAARRLERGAHEDLRMLERGFP